MRQQEITTNHTKMKARSKRNLASPKSTQSHIKAFTKCQNQQNTLFCGQPLGGRGSKIARGGGSALARSYAAIANPTTPSSTGPVNLTEVTPAGKRKEQASNEDSSGTSTKDSSDSSTPTPKTSNEDTRKREHSDPAVSDSEAAIPDISAARRKAQAAKNLLLEALTTDTSDFAIMEDCDTQDTSRQPEWIQLHRTTCPQQLSQKVPSTLTLGPPTMAPM